MPTVAMDISFIHHLFVATIDEPFLVHEINKKLMSRSLSRFVFLELALSLTMGNASQVFAYI